MTAPVANVRRPSAGSDLAAAEERLLNARLAVQRGVLAGRYTRAEGDALRARVDAALAAVRLLAVAIDGVQLGAITFRGRDG